MHVTDWQRDVKGISGRSATRFPVETGCLVALAFVLPLFEAPKNILCALYGLIWVFNRARARDFGPRWDAWDTLILLWIVSGFVVAAGAGIHGAEWRGAVDVARYGGILWTVKRARYGEGELRLLWLSLAVSGIVGLLWGYHDLVTHRRYYLELHSVGQVNHSSIYLAILLGATVGWAASYWRALNGPLRLSAILVCAFFGVSLIVMSSRGAAGAAMIALLVLAVAWLRRSRRLAVVVVGALIVAIASGIYLKAGFVEKQEFQEKSGSGILSFRDRIWWVAWEEWKLHPWFGVGMDNYSRITVEEFAADEAAHNRSVDLARYYSAPHAHSLFFNTLAERGIVGVLPLAAVLALWLWNLLAHLPRGASPPLDWASWAGSASAWIVTVVAGAVNTTLHHEHGILAALLLGGWLGVLARDSGHRFPD